MKKELRGEFFLQTLFVHLLNQHQLSYRHIGLYGGFLQDFFLRKKMNSKKLHQCHSY